MPLDHHERRRRGADDPAWDESGAFVPGAGYPTDFVDGEASRLDAGGRPNIVTAPMLRAGLEQVAAWGPARVAAALRPLTERVARGARALGFAVPSPAERAPHIVGLRVPGGAGPSMPDVRAVGKFLQARGVSVSVRAGAIRVSPFLYNTADDVDRLVALLGDCCREHRATRGRSRL